VSQAQSEVLLRHSATPVSDKHRHASRASRGSSVPADPVLGGELASRKRGHQDMHTEISSDTYYSVNTNNNHNTCDTGDEDPRPAKWRKPRSARAVTPPLYLRRSPSRGLPTIRPEIDEAQPLDDYGYHLTWIDDEQHYTPRTSRSPSTPTESVPIAEYQEWPFQGFLKRTKIGNKTTYNLEFQLPRIPEHVYLPIPSDELGIGSNTGTSAEVGNPHSAVAHSEVRPATLRPKRKRVPWKSEENETILKMKKGGCSWEKIHRALPDRTPGAIQVQYSTKLKK
jgi:hypothetical protein